VDLPQNFGKIDLAETLLPLLAEDKDAAIKEAQEAIDAFPSGFERAYAAGLRRKLGRINRGPQIPVAQAAPLQSHHRGFLPWRFSDAGRRRQPHHSLAAGIRKPSHKRTLRCVRPMSALSPNLLQNSG
jgi:hypothetical protein